MRSRSVAGWLIGGLVGATFGVAGFTFFYAKGASYLGHDAAACANCHVMQAQYDGWMQGSHRAVAACNDCHAPHALLPKLTVKAVNGFRHSLMFTTGWFPEPIRITRMNRGVTEAACRHCHEEIVEAIDAGTATRHGPATRAAGSHETVHSKRGPISCIRCHHGVGHVDFAPLGSFDQEASRG